MRVRFKASILGFFSWVLSSVPFNRFPRRVGSFKCFAVKGSGLGYSKP